MNNEELMTLRGGYTSWWYCYEYGWATGCENYLGPIYWPWNDELGDILTACTASYHVTCGCAVPANW
jgi:hypothetical protein